MKNGEFVLVNLEPVVGYEQGEKRPCLIISNDLFNSGRADLVVILPKTSVNKKIRTHIPIMLEKQSYIKVEDIRSISKKRILKEITFPICKPS